LGQIEKIKSKKKITDISKLKEGKRMEREFFEILEQKMLSIGIKDEIVSFIKKNQSKIFTAYDSLNTSDHHVLNNKVQHIFELNLTDMEISTQKETALQILRTKE